MHSLKVVSSIALEVCLAFAVAGCGSVTRMVSNPAPSVSISAQPATIARGGTAQLTISASNATQVTMTGSNGSSYAISAAGGTQDVSPTSTTTYTVTAAGSGGTASAKAMVSVNNPAPTVAISANPATISSGSSATLTVDATNATEVTLTGTDGSSYALNPSGGTQKVSPSQSTTYAATATGAGGSATDSLTLKVNAAPAPTVAISVNPSSIESGGSSILTVSAANATEVELTGTDGSSYALSPSGGTQKVSPSISTTYTATVTGAGGSAKNSVALTVTPAPAPTVSIAASPATIQAGNPSTLTVTATNATTVMLTGTDGSSYALSPTGGTQSVSPLQNTTYTATVTGPGGTAENSIALTVTPAPAPTVSIWTNSAVAASGSLCVITVTATNATAIKLTGTDGSSHTLAGTGGAKQVSPVATTTYTATATGPGGTAGASTTITIATPATVSMTATPAVIGPGTPSTLTVTASNASTVTVTGTDGSSYTLSPSGGTQTVNPAVDTTYTAWASGATGSVTSSALVQVSGAGLSSIQHIIFTMQENHSFDQYFGALREYWAANGYPDEAFDGLPQFNPVSGAAPLYGPPPTNPGCDPSSPPPSRCIVDPNIAVSSYHYPSECTINPIPGWDEYHIQWNYVDPLGTKPAELNGFAHTAATAERAISGPDINGEQAMGYYDGDDMNYYYFMASNFATSDRWFQSAMTRTGPNRYYLIAGTSQGYAYPTGTDSGDQPLLTAPTIFQELQNAGISWKIYVNTDESGCSGPPYDPACLASLSYIKSFVWGTTLATQYPQNIAPISQFFADAENGTLPQVAEIEPPFHVKDDEHPGNVNNPQNGAQYESTLVNELMQSPSWKDSVFLLTYDEAGGFYDHVSPQPQPSPDGIKPLDLEPGQDCATATGPTCDFVYTGYRIPLLVVSPFTKKQYVSHTVADFTAILKLIETRFNLPPLTNRDAAQMDMSEFFDFNNPPWMTPPTPPQQNTGGVCNAALLP